MGFIDNLKSFNRKERFYLIGLALDNRDFELGQRFWKALNDELHLGVPEKPRDLFCAMDYHLDWIYASLELSQAQGDESPRTVPSDKMNFTQQDVDLLIAFENSDKQCRLIMVEAKVL